MNAESTSRFISAKLKGKKIFKKEGENLNLTWKYEINSLPPHGSKVIEFLFGELIHPGYISRKCVVVDEDEESCESKRLWNQVWLLQKTWKQWGSTTSPVWRYITWRRVIWRKVMVLTLKWGSTGANWEDWFELHSFGMRAVIIINNLPPPPPPPQTRATYKPLISSPLLSSPLLLFFFVSFLLSSYSEGKDQSFVHLKIYYSEARRCREHHMPSHRWPRAQCYPVQRGQVHHGGEGWSKARDRSSSHARCGPIPLCCIKWRRWHTGQEEYHFIRGRFGNYIKPHLFSTMGFETLWNTTRILFTIHILTKPFYVLKPDSKRHFLAT